MDDETARLRAEVDWLRGVVADQARALAALAEVARLAPAARGVSGPAQDIPEPPRRLSRVERGCRVEGCASPHRAAGLCARHYQMWKRGTLTLPEGASGESCRE